VRIAYICADRGVPVRGTKGASVHVRSLVEALAGNGHDVVVASARAAGPNRMPVGVRLLQLPEGDGGDWMQQLFEDMQIEAVIERYALESGAALEVAAACGLPYILEVNAPLVDEAIRFRGLQDARLWRRRERSLLARAAHVVVVSSALRDHVITSGANPASVTVIPNGVALELFSRGSGAAVRARLALGSGFVIGFAGSLKPWHGVRLLLEALRLLPRDIRVLIVGDGPEREALGRMAAEPGLSGRVVFTEAVPHDKMPAYLDAMDVGVAPFEPMDDFYFSPLKVAEYMAAGLPVVASRQGDLPIMVAGGGILFEPGDSSALAGALLSLANDADLRFQLGEASRIRAASMSWTSVAARLQDVLSGQAYQGAAT
jgi:glycosyltransferase involved in cell wall biosynthesis